MALAWDRRYALGHEKIDAEHQIFLGLIVDFKAAAEGGASRDKLRRVLREIQKYAEFHFISEENLMIDSHYPDHAPHAQLHRHLLAEMDDKVAQFTFGTLDADHVFEFLFEWFAMHTSVEDKKLVACLGR